MASQQTEHYGLNQWAGKDNFLRTEFNEDNRKIEAAILGVISTLSARIDALDAGKSSLVVGSYVGDSAETHKIELGFTPRAVIVKNPQNAAQFFHTEEVAYVPAMAIAGAEGPLLKLVEGGFTVPNHNLVNGEGTTYVYLALR